MLASYALCLLLARGALCGLVSKVHTRVDRFQQCPDKKNVTNVVTNTYVSQISYNTVRIFGDINFRRGIETPASMTCIFYKCPSRENMDLCEYIFTFRNEKFCEEMEDGSAPWMHFWSQTSLPQTCPVPPGNYSLNGTKIIMGDMMDMSLFRGYWRSRCVGKTKGKLWTCVQTDFDVSAAEAGGKKSHKPKRRKYLMLH